jgi:hypothetical protein
MNDPTPTTTALVDAVHEALDRLMEAELSILGLELTTREPSARALIASTLESTTSARLVLLRMHVRIESLDITDTNDNAPHLQ